MTVMPGFTDFSPFLTLKLKNNVKSYTENVETCKTFMVEGVP